MAATADSEIRVRFIESDPAGILHYAHYGNFIDIGKNDLFRKYLGRPRKPGDDGVSTVLVQTTFDYKAVARFDDVLILETTLEFVRNSSFGLDFRFRNKETGTVLCIAKATYVSLSLDTRKSTKVPESIQAIFDKEVAA